MALIKKIDKLLIESFIPPFIVTFWIGIFVLIMQTLWQYIEDIAGKGVGFWLMIELLAYRSMSLVPIALPLAMLISSVMVLGNLAEKYELSSIKSAGVSLLRVMFPLMIIGFFIALFSFYCAVSLIPIANLQFGARIYDISKQKPTLRLQTGVFNDDFDGYSIKIGKKGSDGRQIEDILIYDESEANLGRLGQIMAKEGEMYSTEDGRYFIMNLRNGHQYIESAPSGNSNYPFIRSTFDRWTKVFDLGEFQLKRTNPELFKHNRTMLSPKQLADESDSLALKIIKQKKNLSNTLANYFVVLEKDSAYLKKPKRAKRPEFVTVDTTRTSVDTIKKYRDSLQKRTEKIKKRIPTQIMPPKADAKDRVKETTPEKKIEAELRREERAKNNQRKKILPQVFPKGDTLANYSSIIELFKANEENKLLRRAQSSIRNVNGQASSSASSLDNLRENRVKYIYDLHTKYSMAVVCFIFLFVGAPMGAIVRKGGFGYPILIAICFFILFIVLTIFCRKLAESFALPVVLAAWLPCIILFPLGLILTSKAMNDSKMMNFDQYIKAIRSLFQRKKAV